MTEFSLAGLVRELRPKMVVELGTGDGATAARVMEVLRPDAYFTTINWPNPPSGDNPMRYLAPWAGDRRLLMVSGDTREQAWRFPDGSIELLYIDSTHTCEYATAEWAAYKSKLRNYAAVVVDDLDHNDMMKFWDALPYDKSVYHDGTMGVFKYVA